jgi:hypothetical protein
MSPEDEAAISEINILPDGRVCVFGASQQVLAALGAIPLDDAALQDRIECLHRGSVSPVHGNGTMKNQVKR